MAVPVSFARAATAVLGSEKGRKTLGWVAVVTLCSPFIVLIAFLCALGSGMAQHNAQVVTMCFSDSALPGSLPTAYRTDILKARSSFGKIDDAVKDDAEQIEDAGLTLDDKRIKAVFLSLYFGENSPGKRDIRDFVDCFVVMEKTDITIQFEAEKLEALTYFLQKDNTTPQKALAQTLEEMYQQHVPADTREYIERRAAPTAAPRPRPRRPRPADSAAGRVTRAAAGNPAAPGADAPSTAVYISTSGPAPQLGEHYI